MLRAAVFIYGMHAAGALSGVATLWLVARYFAPAEYGQYALYMSFVGVGAFLLGKWTSMAFLRFGREEWTARHRLGRALATQLVLLAGSLGLGCALAWAFRAPLQQWLGVSSDPFWLLALGMVLIPLPNTAVVAGQVIGRPLALGYAPLVQSLVLLATVLVAGWLLERSDWTSLALGTIVGAGIATLAALRPLPSSTWRAFRVDRPLLVKMLRYSWAIPLGSGAAYVIRWVDSWVIRLFADTTAVGLYNWAYQILDFGTAAFSITALLVTPAIIDARLASDRKRLEEYARRAFCLLALFSGSVLVILPCVHPLMQTLIAPPYHGAYSPLLILVGALPFQLMGYLVSPVANAFEHLVARAMFLNVVVAAANAALDFVLVPVFGYPGAAVATWMALAFSAAAQTWVYSRLIGVTLLPLGGAVWVSALPALGCAAILVSGSSWSGTAFCLILLGVATLWLRRVGIFSRHEVMALLQMGLPVPAKRLFSSWWPG